MGHEIQHLIYSGRYGKKRVYAECNKVHKEYCEYHTSLMGLRFPTDNVFKNIEDAVKYIENNDRGFYDQIAVKCKTKDKRLVWLAKIEYHV